MYTSPREKFLGLSLQSSRKSYYPQLKKQLEAAEENERRLQLLIDNLPARIAFVDNQERFVFVNREYEKAFGLKRPQIIGSDIQTIIGPDNYKKAKPYIDRALGGELVQFEALFSGTGGDSRWLDITYAPDIDAEGAIDGFCVLALDFTEKKRVEESLRHKDRLLREIGGIAKIGGWEFDPETGKGTWTDELARIYDLVLEDELTVETGLRFFSGPSRIKIEKALDEAIELGKPFDLELEMTSAKGIHKWVRTIGYPKLENGRVVQVRGSFQDVSEQKRSDQARIVSEERFRLLVESAPDAIFVQTQGSFAYLNSAAVKLFGADSADDLSGSPVIEHVHQDYRKSVAGRIALLNREKRPVPSEHELFLRMDGTSVDVEASAVPMNYKGNDGALVFARDTSARIMAEKEQRKLQDQLFQAQKMESIGRLAGGVAHDYNNFLGVIIGYTELSLMQLNPGDEMHKNLQEVLNAANRSKAVTRQLLAFARKEAIAPEVLDLNATVEGLLKMIRRLIGENIELTWRPRVGLWAVEMDPSQIDQILVNLCVNARDAIVDVGKILIETDNGTIDEDYRIQHDSIVPGDYVTLAISDNGSGMEKVVLGRIFEPFFTTKEMGKGTGLGLSTVYGIVKQNNGFINVYSEPGHGTHFKIYLPKCARGLVEGRKAGLEEIPSGRGETILVVEDEVAILGLTKKILQRCGYNVLAAATPTEAIALAKGQAGSISLLITDVIMPEMNGRDLVEKLKKISPGLNYLFMSGYPADVIAPSGVLEAGVQFIQKPFSAKNLAVKIREILRNAY